MTSTALAVPTRKELELLGPGDLWTLSERAGEVKEIADELLDELLIGWANEGKTQTEIAKLVGRSQKTVSRRYERLGITPQSNRGRPRISQGTNSADEEVIDAEVVEDDPATPRPRKTRTSPDGPAHYLPDVVADDADQNLRTQALHWFEQGQVVKALLDKRKEVTPRSDQDREAIKREAAVMERTARRLKESM